MNAANLITLIQASGQIAGMPALATGHAPAEDGFRLALQQYMLPELGGQALQAGQAAVIAAGGGLAQPSAIAGDVPAEQPLTAAGLLAALSECLAAMLGQCDALESQATGSQTAQQQIITAETQASPVPAQSAEPILTVLSEWRQLLTDLAAVLGGPNARLAVQSTQPVLTTATGLQLSLPWSAAVGDTAILSPAVPAVIAAGSANPPPAGSITAAAEQLAAAPASIKWFVSAGVISAGQSVTEVMTDAAVPVLSSELTTADGTTVRLSLRPAQPLPAAAASDSLHSAAQTYLVAVETSGSDAAALTAQITVSRLDAALPAITANGKTVAPALTSTQPDPVFANATPVTASRPQLTATPAAVELPTAGGTQTVATTSGQAVATATADSASTATVQTAQPLAATTAELSAVSAQDAQPAGQILTADTQLRRMLGADQTLTRRSTPVIPAQPAVSTGAGSSTDLPLASNGWTADQALVQLAPDSPDQALLAQQPQKLGPQLREALPTAAGIPTGEIDLTAIQPNAAEVPAQLMEFVGTRFQIAPYRGLQYQQLLEQLFDKVEQARTAGNGLYNAHLDLNPPSLGKMFVNISVRGDAVAMQLAVAANVPKEQLKDSMEALRQSLEKAGLYVVELQIVEIDGDEQQSGRQRHPDHGEDDGAASNDGGAAKSTPASEPAVKQTPAFSLSG